MLFLLIKGFPTETSRYTLSGLLHDKESRDKMAYLRERKGSWQSIVCVHGYPQMTKTFIHKIDAKRYSRDLEKNCSDKSMILLKDIKTPSPRHLIRGLIRSCS